MKTVEEHLADILSVVGPLPPRPASLADAHGCVLAADVPAAVAVPGFDNSAMDGYAVRSADLVGASADGPVRLKVVGDIPAGATLLPEVTPGTAVRIMTGAPMPPGADAVAQLEWTDGRTDVVTVHRAPDAGLHVRRTGDDVGEGDRVLEAGTLLGSSQIGLLAAVNVARPLVRPRPRVAVMSTGSELVEVGHPLGPGQIVDSNSHAVAAAVVEAGGIVERLTGVPDDPERFARTLHATVGRVDALVTTGGVSVGAYDVVKQVLTGLGTMRFEQVAMHPGKPQGFGTMDGVPVFTLPGNPVSALVSFDLFVRPALLTMRGFTTITRRLVDVEVLEALRSPAGRRSYLRVRVERAADGRRVAYPAGGQGSHQISALAAANALLEVPEDVTEVPAGSRLAALMTGDEAFPVREGMAP